MELDKKADFSASDLARVANNVSNALELRAIMLLVERSDGRVVCVHGAPGGDDSSVVVGIAQIVRDAIAELVPLARVDIEVVTTGGGKVRS